MFFLVQHHSYILKNMISDDYFNTSHINEYMTENTLTNFGTNLKVFYRRNIENLYFEKNGKTEF